MLASRIAVLLLLILSYLQSVGYAGSLPVRLGAGVLDALQFSIVTGEDIADMDSAPDLAKVTALATNPCGSPLYVPRSVSAGGERTALDHRTALLVGTIVLQV